MIIRLMIILLTLTKTGKVRCDYFVLDLLVNFLFNRSNIDFYRGYLCINVMFCSYIESEKKKYTLLLVSRVVWLLGQFRYVNCVICNFHMLIYKYQIMRHWARCTKKGILIKKNIY